MHESYTFIKNLDIKDTIVAGISGGPDSMALLHLLVKLKKELNIKVVCAHVNHNIRVLESEQELLFVKNYCEKNDVIFESMKINHNDNVLINEAYLRDIRYKWLEQIVLKYNSKYLFIAHHGDDLIETILMRIVRGSTLKGYSGFKRINKMNNYYIVRPLIHLTKQDILEYNETNNIEYVIDSSNLKDDYTRNRYRKYILPQLKLENKNVHNKFYKYSNMLLEYNDFVEKYALDKMDKIYINDKINVSEFIKLEHIIGVIIINKILEKIYNDKLMLISDKHVDMIYNLIISNKINKRLNLPNNIVFIKTYNEAFFIKDNINDYQILIDKNIELPNGKKIEIVDSSQVDDNNVCRIDTNEIKLPLYVRNRNNGDKMEVLGLNGHKKINDIFTDCKINLNDRNLWPIVVDSENTIIFLPGLKKSKFCKTKDEKYDIILKYN